MDDTKSWLNAKDPGDLLWCEAAESALAGSPDALAARVAAFRDAQARAEADADAARRVGERAFEIIDRIALEPQRTGYKADRYRVGPGLRCASVMCSKVAVWRWDGRVRCTTHLKIKIAERATEEASAEVTGHRVAYWHLRSLHRELVQRAGEALKGRRA